MTLIDPVSGANPQPATRPEGRLGWTPGQPAIYLEWGQQATSQKRDLSAGSAILPELDESTTKVRRLWQRPAFLLSMALAVVAVAVGAVLLLMSLLGGGPARVSALTGTVSADNIRLTWAGDDVAYSLYAVSGASGPAVDLSQLVRGSHEAWIPSRLGLYDDGTCFVVRATAGFTSTPVSIDATKLDEQGAQRICVADLQ
jgi:hypothetical protein